jgi:hypothetical protein
MRRSAGQAAAGTASEGFPGPPGRVPASAAAAFLAAGAGFLVSRRRAGR